MAPAVRADTDRVKKVTNGDYDQVFALTQYMINIELKNKWIVAKEQNIDLAFARPFDAYQRSLGRLDEGIIGYPRIVVKTGLVETLTGASYMMCFDGEKLEVRNLDEFKETVGTNIKAGDYALNSLVAKFDTAVFKMANSEFPVVDWRSLPKAAEENFKLFVQKIKDDILESLQETRTLGYSLRSMKQSDEPKLNFEPNLIQYTTYPWLSPGANEPKLTHGLEGNSRLNYFLYAETTGQRDLPPTDKRFLHWKGSFTDGRIEWDSNPESGDFGSFAMAKRNLFEGYLLEKLQVLNRVLEPTVNNVTSRVLHGSDPQYHWDCDLRIGQRDLNETDDFYKFKEQTPASWQFRSECKAKQDYCQDAGLHPLRQAAKKAVSHEALPHVCTPYSYDEAGNDGWSAKLWSDAECSTTTTVYFQPGTDIISVVGQSFIKLSMTYHNYHPLKVWLSDEKWTHRGEFRTDWSIQLHLEAADDGGLQILTTFGEVKTDVTVKGIEGLSAYEPYTKTAIETSKTCLTALQKSLAEDLARQRGLVLPAAGVFYFKNRVLGHNGDLICSLSYNETPSKKSFDESPKVNEDANKRADITVKEGQELPKVVVPLAFKRMKRKDSPMHITVIPPLIVGSILKLFLLLFFSRPKLSCSFALEAHVPSIHEFHDVNPVLKGCIISST